MNPQAVTLQGQHARLEPLRLDHAEALSEAVQDGELWRLWYTAIPTPAAMASEVQRRLDLQDSGSMLPFAVIHLPDERMAGMTTYMHIDRPNRRLEIGSTWYRKSLQRTALNTECKRMLLGHAFEALDGIAVEFRTHWHNTTSRQAIERLGARLDGVLRNHQIAANGSLRDTCVYSIVASEWPAVRAHLDHALHARRTP
jgi:RimJ/RimL family protein N-acetyltransferase